MPVLMCSPTACGTILMPVSSLCELDGLLLSMSFRAPRLTAAAMLVSARFFVVWLSREVAGFRPVLARPASCARR
jgi:hypothetical protein